MYNQSSLGSKTLNRLPTFNDTFFAKIISTKDYEKFGKVEVVFLDTSQSSPVWVVGDIDREPVVGDFVLISFVEGKKDAPFLVGFVKNKNKTTNFVSVKENKIRLQLPTYIYDIEGNLSDDSLGKLDLSTNLINENNKSQRVMIELNTSELNVQMPFNKFRNPMRLTMKRLGGNGSENNVTTDGEIELSLPLESGQSAYIKIGENGITMYHPSGDINFNTGGNVKINGNVI